MPLTWFRESPAHWNGDKERIIGGAPAGVFSLGLFKPGDVVPGDWWRVESNGQTVGYGWMDQSWGDAEVLLAVDPSSRDGGIGTFILDRLEDEAADRGINYLYNVVPEAHPDKAGLTRWLQRRGFQASHEGGLLKRAVHPRLT
ncbi:MAG TPA: GNAT family N-acetyltransferase [Vicinamibacterales bacterium]|nr:GNAT family N-acetyltransferase [Vicinamibacterales bacterium]